MIAITKSPLPEGVAIRREEDYRSGLVFQLLVQDSCGKCYICEDSLHTAPNVEHRIPHKGDLSLQYDWHNLFLACSHCNAVKSTKYDGIIDPVAVDPEKVIAVSLDVDDDLRETVIVQKIAGKSDVDVTVDLLKAVYNGAKTDMKKLECQNLKNKISNELLWFRQKLDEYQTDPSDRKKGMIENDLSDKALFAAFKRGIIRNEAKLSAIFASSVS